MKEFHKQSTTMLASRVPSKYIHCLYNHGKVVILIAILLGYIVHWDACVKIGDLRMGYERKNDFERHHEVEIDFLIANVYSFHLLFSIASLFPFLPLPQPFAVLKQFFFLLSSSSPTYQITYRQYIPQLTCFHDKSAALPSSSNTQANTRDKPMFPI